MLKLAFLSVVAMGTAASTTRTAPLPAPDRWNVNVELGKCTLDRSYSEPEGATLSIKTDAGSDDYYLEIATKRNRQIEPGTFMDGLVKIDGRVRAKTYVQIGDGANPSQQEVGIFLDAAAIDSIGQGSELTIALGRNVVSIPLPDAKKAIAALHSCESEQLVEWGADPAQFKPGGTRPKVSNRSHIVSQALMRTVHFGNGPIEPMHYLVLSETGVVEHCEAVFGVPDSDLEQIVCKALMGKKLGEPARDPDGKAVRGVVSFNPSLFATVQVQVSH